MPLPVLVINRAADTDRLAAFRQSAGRSGIDPIRIDAVDAHAPDFSFHDYRDLLRDRFWDSDCIKPGAFGCFLSHRRAWQHVVNSGMTMALVCEDDADFINPPDLLQEFLGKVPDPDVIFANGRMASWCTAGATDGVKPLLQVIADLAGLGGPRALGLKPSPGGDCYLVTLNGANALLDRTAAQGVVCGVDWAIVWNGVDSVDARTAGAFPELGILSRTLRPHQPLKMFALSTPVADQRGGASVLRHSVTVPILDLR